MDALTIVNIDTNELTIVYVGTDLTGPYGIQEGITDLKLIGILFNDIAQ